MERVLITVKTYPTLSKKYRELVCTAGLREDGSWIRLYPVPFRTLAAYNRYQKYDWLELATVRNTRDPRPESFRPVDHDTIEIVGNVDTRDGWAERCRLVLEKGRVHKGLDSLIAAARANELSLATFKPSEITGFEVEATDREWDPEKLDAIRAIDDQRDLFEADENPAASLRLMPKLPYKFYYRFVDIRGASSRMQIIDWEIGQLYWNCLKSASGDEKAALEKVRQKYVDEFASKNLHLFLGTTQQFHGWAKNPFLIIGVFYPPATVQRSLGL